MNNRFTIPQDPIPGDYEPQLPVSDNDKCVLAHKLLSLQMMRGGTPEIEATEIATMVVQDALDQTRRQREVVQCRFRMMSVIHNN